LGPGELKRAKNILLFMEIDYMYIQCWLRSKKMERKHFVEFFWNSWIYWGHKFMKIWFTATINGTFYFAVFKVYGV
jgi:hypothetical protein